MTEWCGPRRCPWRRGIKRTGCCAPARKPTSPVSDEKRSFSGRTPSAPWKTALRFAFASLCFDRAWNLMKFGFAIAARMPMIANDDHQLDQRKSFLDKPLHWKHPFGNDEKEGEQATGQAKKSRRFRGGHGVVASRPATGCVPAVTGFVSPPSNHPAGRSLIMAQRARGGSRLVVSGHLKAAGVGQR